jgi:hypothetical protein
MYLFPLLCLRSKCWSQLRIQHGESSRCTCMLILVTFSNSANDILNFLYLVYFGSSLIALFAIVLPMFALQSREKKIPYTMSLAQEIEYSEQIISKFLQGWDEEISKGTPHLDNLLALNNHRHLKSLLVTNNVLPDDDAYITLRSEIEEAEKLE